MKLRPLTVVVVVALAAACRPSTEWQPTETEQSALRDTLMSLAEQPPAFESADASALRLMWVHPEVALLHGPLTLPLEAGDSAETVSTLVFVVGDSGWEFRRGFGMAPPAEVR